MMKQLVGSFGSLSMLIAASPAIADGVYVPGHYAGDRIYLEPNYRTDSAPAPSATATLDSPQPQYNSPIIYQTPIYQTPIYIVPPVYSAPRPAPFIYPGGQIPIAPRSAPSVIRYPTVYTYPTTLSPSYPSGTYLYPRSYGSGGSITIYRRPAYP